MLVFLTKALVGFFFVFIGLNKLNTYGKEFNNNEQSTDLIYVHLLCFV